MVASWPRLILFSARFHHGALERLVFSPEILRTRLKILVSLQPRRIWVISRYFITNYSTSAFVLALIWRAKNSPFCEMRIQDGGHVVANAWIKTICLKFTCSACWPVKFVISRRVWTEKLNLKDLTISKSLALQFSAPKILCKLWFMLMVFDPFVHLQDYSTQLWTALLNTVNFILLSFTSKCLSWHSNVDLY